MSPAILIVDDETTFARNVATYLVRNGYRVCRAETAEQGLLDLDTFRPALVLQDFNLPGMDGLEMLAEIRRRDGRIKVILMTGQGGETLALDAMKSGAHEYLTKPVSLAQLKIVVEATLGQRQGIGARRLRSS